MNKPFLPRAQGPTQIHPTPPPHPLASPVTSPVTSSVRMPVTLPVTSGTLFLLGERKWPKSVQVTLGAHSCSPRNGQPRTPLIQTSLFRGVLKVYQSSPRGQTASIETKSVCQGDRHPLWQHVVCFDISL